MDSLQRIDALVHDLTAQKQESQIQALLDAVRREEMPAAQAMRYVDRTLKTVRRIGMKQGDETSKFRTLFSIGESYELLGGLERAAGVYQEALELSRLLKDRAGEASLHWKMGRVARKRNRWDEALQHLRQGRSMYEDLEPRKHKI